MKYDIEFRKKALEYVSLLEEESKEHYGGAIQSVIDNIREFEPDFWPDDVEGVWTDEGVNSHFIPNKDIVEDEDIRDYLNEVYSMSPSTSSPDNCIDNYGGEYHVMETLQEYIELTDDNQLKADLKEALDAIDKFYNNTKEED